MIEPGRPGTTGESDGTLPGDLAGATPVRFAGPEPAASRFSPEEKNDLHWAALNRRMDRLLEGMQTQRARLSPPGLQLVPPPEPPPPPAKPEEESSERQASVARAGCPRCTGRVHPSTARGLFEHLLKLLGSCPLRCHSCYYRYAVFMGTRFILRS